MNLAIPPGHLMRLSVGSADPEKFIKRGRQSYEKVMAALQSVGCELVPGVRVLEWGCGCGRIARHFSDRGVDFVGIDITVDAVEWCQKHLVFGQFSVCSLLPPTRLPSGSFDVIYSGSVLTHLSIAKQIAWMKEIFRLLKPDGLVLLTFHGAFHIVRSHLRDGFRFSHVNTGLFAEVGTGEEGSNEYGTFQTREALQEIFFPFSEKLYIQFHDILGGQDTIIFQKRCHDLSGEPSGMDSATVIISSDKSSYKQIEVEISDGERSTILRTPNILERQTKILHTQMQTMETADIILRRGDCTIDETIFSATR